MSAFSVEEIVSWIIETCDENDSPDIIRARFEKLFGVGMSKAELADAKGKLSSAIVAAALARK